MALRSRPIGASRQIAPSMMYGGYSASGITTPVAATGYAGFATGYGKASYDISYDTSSKDPQMMRARVFVGNVNTMMVGRDELIELFGNYGTLLGITVFKGYAFIQYSNAAEADFAVQCTNGMQWRNQALDVKLAITNMKHGSDANKQPQTNSSLKRLVSPNGTRGEKRAKNETGFENASIVMQNAANQMAASRDTTNNSDLAFSAYPDTMICGTCRTVFSDFEQFRDHRTKPCSAITTCKPDGEPEKMQCFTCEEVCDCSWTLVKHLVDRHGLSLYK